MPSRDPFTALDAFLAEHRFSCPGLDQRVRRQVGRLVEALLQVARG